MFKVNPKLCKTNTSLTTYGNFNLKPNGSLMINCSTDALKNVPLPFYVVNVKSKPILGLRGCKELKLIERIDAIKCSISKNELIVQYKDVISGVGEFPNESYHITLKNNAVPVIYPPRRVPLALQPKLKSTLDRLEKEGIVSKVNKPTDWVQSLVIVEKPNGNLRLCLDPRDLNKLVPYRPFEKIGVDIMDLGNTSYLVVIDYYSKWIEIAALVNKSADEVIIKPKTIFSRFGVPNMVVSDNVPFNSYIYKKFANDWDFDYAFISPHYSPSNGMVEKAAGISKRIMKKAREDRRDYLVGLMDEI
ncbi:uncharacterized protein K02A2.6 [Trichonephila clavipes]|nr:uncharacterized protein K02A2.6 [Trichonephila clavipes]